MLPEGEIEHIIVHFDTLQEYGILYFSHQIFQTSLPVLSESWT
jgi:hypothetical protein